MTEWKNDQPEKPMITVSSPQSLFLSVVIGFLLTLPAALWLRDRDQKPRGEPGQQPVVVENLKDTPGLQPGESVPAASLRNLRGEGVELLRPEDGYTLLAFFSTDCPKCADEAEVWKKLVAQGPRHDTKTYLVATDKDPGVLSEYLAEHGLADLPVLYAADDTVARHFRMQFLPQYLLFNRTGKVVHRDLGYLSVSGMAPDQRVQALFGATQARSRPTSPGP